jgi:peptidoglycan/LPS O-acetylase OafA/YrhL
VSDSHFLYPFSTFAGTGVDIFLFLSGYGLSMSMSKRPLSVGSFYKQRLLRLFVPFWIVLALIVLVDATILGIQYSPTMLIQSVLAWFPRADVWADIDSPFWYMTWLLLFYLLFPIFWIKRRSYLTALILAFLASAVAFYDPLHLQTTWLHRLHTLAFPLGILIAWFATERSHITQKLIQWKGSSW